MNNKATIRGNLTKIKNCYIVVPLPDLKEKFSIEKGLIEFYSLPDVSDGKQATYNNDGIQGRSFPLYTYSHSGDRTINMQLHFYIINPGDARKNIDYLRLIQSAVYPRRHNDNLAPYRPPPICLLRVGELLGESAPVCAVLQSYNVKYPTDVAWDEETCCPYKFDIDTNWLVVYNSQYLPFQDRIIQVGA